MSGPAKLRASPSRATLHGARGCGRLGACPRYLRVKRNRSRLSVAAQLRRARLMRTTRRARRQVLDERLSHVIRQLGGAEGVYVDAGSDHFDHCAEQVALALVEPVARGER